MSETARTLLVTGGSRGIGRAIVIGAVRRGHRVLFTYNRGADAAEETIALARKERADAAVHAHQLDVRDAAAAEQLVDELVQQHTQIHALVNNAATLMNNSVALMSNEEWQEVIDTNLNGPFYLIRSLLMHFISYRFGRIVNLLSLAADGSSGQANYAASKGGMIGLTRTVAREYGQKNITCNGVTPGMVRTDMVNENLGQGLDKVWLQYSPMRRLHEAAEIADAVLFLISDNASSINGEVINVTGGMSYVP